MPTDECVINLFYRVDETMGTQPKYPQATVHPSERVTLAVLHPTGARLKGGGPRAFYCWISHKYRAGFPALPERTRLFHLFAAR